MCDAFTSAYFFVIDVVRLFIIASKYAYMN